MKTTVQSFFSSVVLGLSLIIGMASCSFPFQSPQEVALQDISGKLGYNNVSRQAFMGGSVLYNPEQPSSGQLADGVHVAVRLGKVDVEKGDPEQPSFSDREADAQYGYITVSSISKELIGFTYTEYAIDGKTSRSASFTVGLNDKADINGDGLPDITYVQPERKRPGMEKAIYLTFLSSQETLNTAMFAVLPEQYSRGVYPSGIIGINPDGRFIVSKYEGTTTNRAAVQGIIYGDYVLDAQQRIYQKMIGSKTYQSARSIDDFDLKNTESISYETLLFSIEEFDELTTPENLFNALPEVIKIRFDITGADKQMTVNILNQVLTQYDLIESVAAIQEIDLTADELAEVKTSIHNLSAEEIIIVNRLFLSDNFQDTCPEAQKNPDDIAFILPLFSCYLGGNEVDNTGDTEVSRAVSTYSDYTAKRNAIEKKFSQLTNVFSFDIPTDKIPNSHNINGYTVSVSKALKLGVW